MPRTAAAGIGSLFRAGARTARRCLGGPLAATRPWLAAALILIGSTASGRCETDPVKGEATFSAAGGYARLVLKLADEVDSEVTVAGSILVIRFKQPVDIPVDEIAEAVPGYVGSARRDPDGMAIRLSLSRRVTINTMTAGERIFVDLLPDSWSGAPPSLPQDVIKELAERARAAERALRVQRATDAAKKRAAHSRSRIGAADLRSLRVRNARWRQRLVSPERAEAHVVLQCRAQFRPCRRQDSRACERRLDHPEGRLASSPPWKSH